MRFGNDSFEVYYNFVSEKALTKICFCTVWTEWYDNSSPEMEGIAYATTTEIQA